MMESHVSHVAYVLNANVARIVHCVNRLYFSILVWAQLVLLQYCGMYGITNAASECTCV